ncbi:MAG TPA: DUF4179 domain-containing protein [Oscillospiraceae bacterium]|nr:DUF4179 domain-containing protein [Oscillospiraceae bacterium]HPF56776.1 DUF4179 domain-containing protein [Clostridiales bacterium]HPK36278.1 DUF4179 domain-containing protein [Oscillospiraceae bacterium]HPR76912.1 DUF4179 domain-containing protein [Oscillospiraceae bacterium]
MNSIDQKIETALERVTLSQSAKYRVKNKIQSAVSHPQKRVRGKLSVSAAVSLILASLLVISAAAIGGLSYFHALYGDQVETLTPYGITIGTSVQNEDVILTLHESVADEYTTAYIFSIRGLTETGKTLVTDNTLDLNACEISFWQTNKGDYSSHSYGIDNYQVTSVERIPPAENTDCQLYEVRQKYSGEDYQYLDIGLKRDNVTYYDDNNANYAIIPIESLREEDCEYYALYIISPETQDLILTFDDLELPLPESKTQVPGIEVQIDGYIQDYFMNEEGIARLSSYYPTSAVLTPLGLYVNDEHLSGSSLMYMNAVLVFNDDSEIELSELSNERISYMGYYGSYLSNSYAGAVYLFYNIMDTSTIKSLLFYNEIEFPFDGSTPFIRSSGRYLESACSKVLLWTITEQIESYVQALCPDTWTVTYANLDEPLLATGWGNIYYVNDDTLRFHRANQSNERDASFYISLTEISDGTLEEEARAMVEEINITHHAWGYENDLTFTVTGTGTYDGMEVIVVECGETDPGLYKRCIFAIYEGRLLTIEYDGYTGQPNDYAFDALLDLITFD